MKLTFHGLNVQAKKTSITSAGRKIPLLSLTPKERKENVPDVLWIHGGGYMLGMKEMVYMSRAVDFVEKYGIVVIALGYRLSWKAPYSAAIEDCYATLLFSALRKYPQSALRQPLEILMALHRSEWESCVEKLQFFVPPSGLKP